MNLGAIQIFCYKCENIFSKTDILAKTLIEYDFTSVNYRKHKADIDDYSGVCISLEGKGGGGICSLC